MIQKESVNIFLVKSFMVFNWLCSKTLQTNHWRMERVYSENGDKAIKFIGHSPTCENGFFNKSIIYGGESYVFEN